VGKLEHIYKEEQLGMDYAAQGLKRMDAMYCFSDFVCV
jgi:hypothetical protein